MEWNGVRLSFVHSHYLLQRYMSPPTRKEFLQFFLYYYYYLGSLLCERLACLLYLFAWMTAANWRTFRIAHHDRAPVQMRAIIMIKRKKKKPLSIPYFL